MAELSCSGGTAGDETTYIPEHEADETRTPAHTVVNTVMAEQVGGNVVGNFESASGSPLVDAHANDQTTDFAGNGILSATTTEPKSNLETTPLVATDDAVANTDADEVSHAGVESGANLKPGPITLGADGITNGNHSTEGSADGRDTPDISGNVSVSSDTEGSRTDALDPSTEGTTRHVRANSVKKPTTFSKVSVTKNFLAKTVTGSAVPSTTQPSSRASPLSLPPTPTARPRLIAKTGPSLISKPRTPAEGVGAPDPNKVWNKNRAPQPAPSKQFTDEELKQQYGIHLASRLQSDENSKESKWADIDDDDDDWAPETVVWMDGTKSTLTAADAVPPQKEAPRLVQPAKPADAPRPTIIQAKRASEIGPTKTILKPGAAAQAKQNGTAAASPGPEAKGTAVKSPAPVPAKSPWRPVPSVDLVPIVTPPEQQPQQSHHTVLPPQDARAYDSGTSIAPQPAREMAPDTFDRSWREGEGGSRELFNSANGRYEPAPEARRNSRPDPYGRKPSVLQRPGAAASPAEPSPAFQTRSQGEVAPWESRRRGSSFSQGSLSGRRMSFNKPHDMPSPATERRQSTVIGHDMRTAPPPAKNEQQPRFAQQSNWDQQLPPPPSSDTVQNPMEDAVAVQQRLMKEKREEAVRRRKEEEEKAEAEKRERLAAKLAALEGVGKSKKEREAEEAAKKVESPAVEKPANAVQPQPSDVKAPETADLPVKPVETAAPPTAQTTSPTPTTQPQQASQTLDEKLEVPSPIPPKVHDAEAANRQGPRGHLSPRAGARGTFNQQPSPSRQQLPPYSSHTDRQQQPFARSPANGNDAFAPWPTTASNGNIWGSSGVGNGTFSVAPMPMSQQGASLPPPPGMSQTAPGSNRLSPQGFGQGSRSPSLQPQQLSEQQQPQHQQQQQTLPPPGIAQRSDPWPAQGRGAGVAQASGMSRQAHPPGPIAPPSRSQQQQAQTQALHQDPVSAWNSAASRLPHQYKADAEAADRKPQEMMVPAGAVRDETIRETFKRTSDEQGRLGGPRRFQSAEYTLHDQAGSRSVPSLSPAPPSTQTQPLAPLPSTSPLDSWKAGTESTVRIPDGSLNPAHGGTQQLPTRPQPAVVPPHLRSSTINFRAGPLPQVPGFQEASPPPPETPGHPVFEGAIQPKVRLPSQKPIVKLPPAIVAPQSMQSNNAMLPHRSVQAWAPPGVARPIAMDPAWQARFNGLFNRTPIQTETPPSPPKTPPKVQAPALAIASSSRVALDEAPVADTKVSLPQVKRNLSAEGFTLDDSDAVVSKPGIEQMFSEEPSFGSRPSVRVPKAQDYDAAVYDYSTSTSMLTLTPEQSPKAVETQGKAPLPESQIFNKSKNGIFVKMLANGLKNKLVLHEQPTPSPSAQKSSARQDRKPSAKFGKGKEALNVPKPRSASSPVVAASGSSTPSAPSRKASQQKPSGASALKSSSPAEASSSGSNGKRESKWAKPPRGAHPPQKARV